MRLWCAVIMPTDRLGGKGPIQVQGQSPVQARDQAPVQAQDQAGAQDMRYADPLGCY